MKFGIRVPSLNKRISARTSVKRYVRQNLGVKAPKGYGWITNPKKAVYNRVYNRTSKGCLPLVAFFFIAVITLILYI
jgi:hypothetical protein